VNKVTRAVLGVGIFAGLIGFGGAHQVVRADESGVSVSVDDTSIAVDVDNIVWGT